MSRDGVIEVVCRHPGPSHDPVLRAAALVQAQAVFQLCTFQRGISSEEGHPFEPGFARLLQNMAGSSTPMLFSGWDYDRCACGEHQSAWVHSPDWKPMLKEAIKP